MSEVSHVRRFLSAFLRVPILKLARFRRFSVETSNSTKAITFSFFSLFRWSIYFFHLSGRFVECLAPPIMAASESLTFWATSTVMSSFSPVRRCMFVRSPYPLKDFTSIKSRMFLLSLNPTKSMLFVSGTFLQIFSQLAYPDVLVLCRLQLMVKTSVLWL